MKAVLFDLDGTLLDRRATFRLHLEGQVARFPEIFAAVDGERYVRRLVALDENGTLDRDEFHQRAESELELPAGSSAVLKGDFEDRFPEECVGFAGLHRTLEALRRGGCGIGLITNGRVVIQTRKIARLAIRPLMDTILISEAVGYRKPDRRIFERGLRELGVTAIEAAYVGDNPEPDILGARAAGMVAIWRRDPFWPPPPQATYSIDELQELLPIVFGS